MVKENPERNARIYELWVLGLTIDEIALETGYPRSTVGYYIRKFNKKAKRGELIILPHVVERPDSETLALQAVLKSSVFVKLTERINAGDLDTVYKSLMILKLVKELQRDLFSTKEESEAFLKVLTQGIK